MRSRDFLQPADAWIHSSIQSVVPEGPDQARFLWNLTDREAGESVRQNRSSWVCRLSIADRTVFAKTYDYPSRKDRWRGLFRNTAFARSRAARERDAAEWLATAGLDGSTGLQAPEPLLVAEWRSGPLLRRALIVTGAAPGRPLDELWPDLTPSERDGIRRQLGRAVEALHAAGYRDRNLDPRNLIVESRDGTTRITKIDSPRYRVIPTALRILGVGRTLARADRERLERGLRALESAP